MKTGNIKNYRHGRISIHIIPILVWLCAVGGVIGLFHVRAKRFEIIGIAQGQERQIAATCRGRITNIKTGLFEEVRAGQELAVLNIIPEDSQTQEEIEAKRATLIAELDRLKAELKARQEQLNFQEADREANAITEYRRFLIDIESAKVRYLELKAELEPEKIKLQNLQLDTRLLMAQEDLELNEAALLRLQKLKLTVTELEKSIQHKTELLAQAEKDLEETQQRLHTYSIQQPETLSIETALEPIRHAINVQQKKIEELTLIRQPLTLVAPYDGIVRNIQHRIGEVVLAGDPVLTLAENKPRQVEAWIHANMVGHISKDMQVRIIKNTKPEQIVTSNIVHLGPTIELLPKRLWKDPNIEEWGRRMLVEINPGMNLIPGEVVHIRGL